jgi:hypothetical protein
MGTPLLQVFIRNIFLTIGINLGDWQDAIVTMLFHAWLCAFEHENL